MVSSQDMMVPTRLLPDGSDHDEASGEHQPSVPLDVTEGSSPPVGATVGRYVVLGPLGRGGMGTVLKAYDEALDRAIALKLLHPGVGEQHAERLTREAQGLARLSHPNVVHVYEVAEADGRWFITMELVHGTTLRTWQRARPPWSACVEAYLQAGEGLSAAHAQGLVHRDFKPDNCIVDDEGRVKVLDFGLVREIGSSVVMPPPRDPAEPHHAHEDREPPDPSASDSTRSTPSRTEHDGPRPSSGRSSLRGSTDRPSLTETGTVVGTLAYMPLEQLTGHTVDARSDQFSFCVSLYEAVYGERPFAGKAVAPLMLALRDNEIRPAPKGIRVPARLRRALLRGLSREPDERWPSMDPLLAELRELVTPPRRTWPILVVGGGLLAVAGGLWALARDERPCRGSAEQLSGVWDDDRRREVRGALMATELSYASDTWERVQQRLDAYAEAWEDRHRETCEATNVRKEQSVEVMDLRMGCLSTRRLELRETVRVLARATPATVDRAVGMVADLRAPSYCDDVEALRAQVPPPDDPTVAAEVDELRQQLLRVHSWSLAGEYDEGMKEVEAIVDRAAALGHPPLQAEAWLERGLLHEKTGRYAEAEDDLQRAYLLAAEHAHEEIETEAVSTLSAVVGRRRAQYERGLQWGKTALALSRGPRADPRAEAMVQMNIATVLHEQGELEQAEDRYRAGLTIAQEVLGSDHPTVGTMLNNIGAVLFTRGQYARSLKSHQRALEIWEDSLGPGHPYVGSSLNNIGEVLHRQGQLEAALSHYRRALELWETSLGPEHPYVAAARTNLGSVASDQGRPDEALLNYRRALAIRRSTLGERHPEVARSLVQVASAQQALGQLDDAAKTALEALDVVQRTLGGDHPQSARPRLILSEIAMARGEVDDAVAYAERAVTVRESAEVPAVARARAQWVLVRARGLDPERRVAALESARELQDAIDRLGPGHEDWRAEVEAWLVDAAGPR